MKLRDDEDMERFIAEQRARLAHEKETLERNPPSALTVYVADDAATKRTEKIVDNANDKLDISLAAKENSLRMKPPTPQLFKLGEAYKQQKEKLKEELRQEYRQALAEKQIRTSGVRGNLSTTYQDALAVNRQKNDDLDLGLSLPIRDHLSAKERLRLQRNKEYNEFLANKENEEKLKSPRQLLTQATPISYPIPPVADATQTTPPVPEKKPLIKESYQELLDRKRHEENVYRHAGVGESDAYYREKGNRRYTEDDEDERYMPRKVGFAHRRRPQYADRYYDDDFEDEDDLIERLRARRLKRRRTRRFLEEDDDYNDEPLFERMYPQEVVYRDERRRLNSAQSRANAAAKESNKENDLRSKSAPPEQEYTGLPIGSLPSANTVQRKKDQYKHDLQKQMEENLKNKRKSRQLEMQIDPSGANDPEKRADRLQDLSPRRQTTQRKQSDNPQEGANEPQKTSKKKAKKRASFRKSDSDDSEEDERMKWRPPHPQYPPYYGPPPPMNGYYPGTMPFTSPYDEAYYYYGARNPLDAATASSMNQGAFPPGNSPLLAAAQSKTSGMKPLDLSEFTREAANQKSSLSKVSFQPIKTDSSLVADEHRDVIKKKEMMKAYQEELKEQMNIKERKREEAKLEQERYERKIEAEAMNYNPWGKGGGGAPMRDIHGNLISDLRQMHLQNEELVRDPTKVVELAKQRQQMIESTEEIFQTPRKDTLVSELQNSPRYGRSNPFELKETFEQKSIKDVYKDELQKQIEERRRLEAERKNQLKKMEEKEERKLEEENKKMQEEYENEQRKQREKMEEQRRKNEEIQRALEEKRLEDERKRKEEQRKREEEERLVKERELEERLKKTASPRIKPQEKPPDSARSHVSRQEIVPKQAVTEEARPPVVEQQPRPPPVVHERTRSPAVVANRPDRSRESKRISRELSALRKQLLNEQQRIENQLRTSDVTNYQFGAYQPTIKHENLVDLSHIRQRPVHVRRPPTVERPNSSALREFTDFKHRQDDTTSLRMFRIQHPDTPSDASAFEKQQEDLIKSQMMKIETMKGRNFVAPHHSTRSPYKSGKNAFSLLPPSDSQASLLEADTSYIPVTDEQDIENRVPPSPPRQRKSSARERRRLRRNEEEGGVTYRAAADNYSVDSLNSLATLDIERMANKNQQRLDKLKAIQGDDVSLTDPDDILDRFVSQHRNNDLPDTPDTFDPMPRRPRKGTSISAPQQERPPSVNTVDTELWLRPGTGPPATAT